MAVRKLSATDGFVVHDYPDAPSSGFVRMGRKILQRSSTDLARSATYAFAFHGIRRGGASAGLNAEGEAAGPAIEALLAELSDSLGDATLELLPGKGVTAPHLDVDETAANQLLGSGAVASARWALGELEGASFAVEGFAVDNPSAAAVAKAFEDAGARRVEADPGAKPWEIWGSEADVLVTGSKPGAMNHQGAEMVKARAVIPWGPVPITTKALAVLLSKKITYIPDFVSASGPFVAHHLGAANGQSPEQALANGITDGLDRAAQTTDESLFVACCLDAESYLDSWQDHRPFGRPLAG